MKTIKRVFIGIILNAAALFAVTYLLEEITYTGGFAFFVVGGVIIGFLNTFVKPLMKILSLPLMIISVGLFTIVINAVILWFTKYFLDVIQFRDVAMQVSGIGAYVIGALLFGLVNWGAHLIIKNR
ncbi:MAG: phage holin family protein [Patescibacteria group bacterium]|nr:phage holin family protein [Patescibacteria group bacterium]